MKTFGLLAAAWLVGFFGVVNTEAAGAGKLNVLVVTGGHGFERKPFLQMFEDNAEIAFTHPEHAPGSATGYERAVLRGKDVLVLYDMAKIITEAQKARLRSAFERGIGFVVLHHALASFQHWPDYGFDCPKSQICASTQ